MVSRRTNAHRGTTALAGFILAAFVVLNLWLLSTHHEIRIALRRIIELESSAELSRPANASSTLFKFESPSNAAMLGFPVPESLSSTSVSWEITKGLLGHFGEVAAAHSRHWQSMPESPARMRTMLFEHGRRGTCYNDAILLASILQQEGLLARVVDLDGEDGLGGGGHNVVEAWLADEGRWVMLDPQQCAFFVSTEGKVLSLLEVREALLGDGVAVEAVRVFENEKFWLTVEELPEYYRKRIANVSFRRRNDWFYMSEKTVPGRLSSYIEAQSSRFGSSCVTIGRFTRSLLDLTPSSYRLRDAHNPESYNPALWYWGYRAFLLAALASVGYLAWRAFAVIVPRSHEAAQSACCQMPITVRHPDIWKDREINDPQ